MSHTPSAVARLNPIATGNCSEPPAVVSGMSRARLTISAAASTLSVNRVARRSNRLMIESASFSRI